MFRHRIAFPALVLGTLLFCLSTPAIASGPATPSPDSEYVYHTLIPLGSDTFAVQPWGSVMTVLASVENPHFEGWRRQLFGERRRLVNASGQPVRYYPERLEFRVSAGTRTPIAYAQPFPMTTTLNVNDYLLNVRFRLKIFHGLRQTVVMPESMAVIGVPADIPYDQRIYRVSFDLDQVSTDDRMVLEVLAPSGERLCKFPLDLL